MSKYFTPITELPGDSGKSESAAGMVRYKRSTSNNNKFSKSLSSSTRFVSPQKMFPASTEQSVPNSGKFLKKGTSLSKAVPPIVDWLTDRAKDVASGAVSLIDFTFEALDKNIPEKEILDAIDMLIIDTSAKPSGAKVGFQAPDAKLYVARDVKQKEAAKAAAEAEAKTSSTYDPRDVMPSGLRDAFKQFGDEWEARPQWLFNFPATPGGSEQGMRNNRDEIARMLNLDPTDTDNIRDIEQMMETSIESNLPPVNPVRGGLPFPMTAKTYKKYAEFYNKLKNIDAYDKRHPHGSIPFMQAAKRIAIDPVTIGTTLGLGYGGYKLYDYLRQNDDPVNQNDSLDSNNNFTPPADNTVKPIATPIPKSNDPFNNMGAPLPTPQGNRRNNQLKTARLQKGGGRFAKKDPPPVINSLDEAWEWFREYFRTEGNMLPEAIEGMINQLKKQNINGNLPFKTVKDDINRLHDLLQTEQGKISPATTTLAPVVDKEFQQMQREALKYYDLTLKDKKTTPSYVIQAGIDDIKAMSKADLANRLSALKSITPPFAGLKRSASDTAEILTTLFGKAKAVNWFGGLDEAQRLVDTARQKNVPATIKDAAGNDIPNPYYTVAYNPSKIIDPNAKGLEWAAQSYADAQVNPQRKWTKNAINYGGPAALLAGLGTAGYNYFTQPPPPTPPEPAWVQNNGVRPRDDNANYVLPRASNALGNATNGTATAAQINAKRTPADRASTPSESTNNLNPKLNAILNEMGIEQSELNPKILRYVNDQLDAELKDNPISTRRINDWKDYSLLNSDQLRSLINGIKKVPVDAKFQDYIEAQKEIADQGVAMLAGENKEKNKIQTANWGRDMITGDEPNMIGQSYNNGLMPNLLNAVSFGLIPKAKYDAPKYLTYPKITSNKDVPQSSTIPFIAKETKKRASSVKKADQPWSRDRFYNTTPRKMKTPDYVTSTTNTRFANLSDKEKGRMAATQAFQEAKKKYKNTSDVVQHTISRAGEIARDIGLGAVGVTGMLVEGGISGFNDLKQKAKSSKDFMSGVVDVYEEKVGTDQKEKSKRQKMSTDMRNKFESGIKSLPSDTMIFANSMIEQSKPVIRRAINQSKPVIRNMINQSKSGLSHLAENASDVSQDVINGITNWMQSNSSKGKTTKRYVEKSMDFQKSMTTANSIEQNQPTIQKHRNKYIDGK